MKTCWEFHFDTENIKFEKQYKYKGFLKGDFPEEIETFIEIIPENEAKFPKSDQSGKLLITIPYDVDDSKKHAYVIAHHMAEKVSFENNGHMKIHGGLISAKRIPETEEEKKEVGDKPFFIEVALEEVMPLNKFDSKSIMRIDPGEIGLLRQFNEAKKANTNIEKFLGLFKIIENIYLKSNEKIKALEINDELSNIVLNIKKGYKEIGIEDYATPKNLIKKIIKVRHKCAHLRENFKFGYTSDDPNVKEELEKMLIILKLIVIECIKLKG